jgi:hypothetical protein
LPSLKAFIALLQVRCAATWDRIENRPRWVEPPNLMAWLEKQLFMNAVTVKVVGERGGINGNSNESTMIGEKNNKNISLNSTNNQINQMNGTSKSNGNVTNGINGKKEMNGRTGKNGKKQNKGKIQETTFSTSPLSSSSSSHLDNCIKDARNERCSFLPQNDPFYFIYDNQLPNTWVGRSVRNIPSEYHSKIIRCFQNSYMIEMSNLDNFKVN